MKNKKSLIALVALLVIGVVSGTFAYYTTSKNFKNTFTTGKYETTIKEKFESPKDWTPGTETEKIVKVTNDGDVKVAVRASYTENWVSADRTVVLEDTLTTADGEERIALFEIDSNWVYDNGYYYYNKTLENGESTTDFISSVTFNPNFALLKDRDIVCSTYSDANGYTGEKCVSTTTGYAGATYTLDITLETIQADQAWK